MSRLFALCISALVLAGCMVGAAIEAESNGSKADLVVVAEWPGDTGLWRDAWFVFHCANDAHNVMHCVPHGMSIAQPGERMIPLVPRGSDDLELDDGQSVMVYYVATDALLGPPPQVYTRVCPEAGSACYYLRADHARSRELPNVAWESARAFVGKLIYGESVTRAFLQHERLGPFLTRLRSKSN